MVNNISVEQSLKAYRVMNQPTSLSWKQHWAQETFSEIDMLRCSEEERRQFDKRLKECNVTFTNKINDTYGAVGTLKDLVDMIYSPDNKGLDKSKRKVVYSSNNGKRPIGDEAYSIWNGFQVIDMDIKDFEIAKAVKVHIFNKLHKCNWFLGVAISSSGMGLHVYTKIAIPESDEDDIKRKKLLYLVNARHKYSFVYIACLSIIEQLGATKEDLINWLDFHQYKPQQGAFVTYDAHPLINTGFFEDFIYVNFDNVEDIGSPEIDWVTYPDLVEVFKSHEKMEFDEHGGISNLKIEAVDTTAPGPDSKNVKVHYKHDERWRLANTLVGLYGRDLGYKYLRRICSLQTKDQELLGDCNTAHRYNKMIDPWAVNRLNSLHGFSIKMNIKDDSFSEEAIFHSMDQIENPTHIRKARNVKEYKLKKDEYLGDIRHRLLDDMGRVTLIDAGAGVGKTEMVKQIAKEGNKVMLVVPFTSIIKSKVQNEEGWEYSYGNRKPKLDTEKSLCLTVDKFSHMNLMDIKANGFDYIFIDESHLLFMSEYRPIMPKVIEMISNTETPIILMSGTPTGELAFFPDIVYMKVTKEDVRKKVFNVRLVNNPSSLLFHMCRKMAQDIMDGRRILFPTNSGTLYSKQIKAGVTYFLQQEHMYFDEVRLNYYKKANNGEGFMDDVNFKRTVKDTQILLCTSYLSVGVDIIDKYNFSIYFADLMMPQEVEQFANRLRAKDLYINFYIAENDAEGNSRSLHKYKEANYNLSVDEQKNMEAILSLCNDMIKRNPVEYMYNALISSIIHENKFVEYNNVTNEYYLNKTAYNVIYFERKYRAYVEQLPVLMKGMEAYGYEIVSQSLTDDTSDEGTFLFKNLKTMMKLAYDEQLKLNTELIDELMGKMTEGYMDYCKKVLRGEFDIIKGNEWSVNTKSNTMIVKDVEIFDKVAPVFASLSKQYAVDSIRGIFEYCKNKGGSYNFAAIRRIKLLVNLLYNDKNNRLDLPIKIFMKEAYDFSELGKVNKIEIDEFLQKFAIKYAVKISKNGVDIIASILTMKTMLDSLRKLFRCLIDVSRPTKGGMVTMKRVELLWKEKDQYTGVDHNDKVFILSEFLDSHIEQKTIEDTDEN